MNIDISLTNIIEWLIAIFLGVAGWFLAISSTLSQQKKERYNNLIQDFHSFIYEFQFRILPDMISQNDKRYIIIDINRQIKFIYFKAKDLDSLVKYNKVKIYQEIKQAGEKFIDSALLDSDIENALISLDKNEQVDIQRKNFFKFADKFVEDCYFISKFNVS